MVMQNDIENTLNEIVTKEQGSIRNSQSNTSQSSCR